MTTDRKILLWGGGSKARILIAMIQEQNLGDIELVFDETIDCLPFSADVSFSNQPSDLAMRLSEMTHFAVCVGGAHGLARSEIASRLQLLGLECLSVVHDTAFIDPTSSLGTGSQIMPNATIHKFCKIGNNVVVNTNATIDHECVIGDGVHIMGSAAIAGRVSIGNYSTIGTNATILPDITIGKGVFVGAGAVVTGDIPDFSVHVGVPSKHIKQNKLVAYTETLDRIIENAKA